MKWNKTKRLLKKIWFFIWEDNSIWSWLVNIVLAFVLIKFIVYPGLGFLLQTSHPVVAVVSSSMEHKAVKSCVESDAVDIFGREFKECNNYKYVICGNTYDSGKTFNLDEYWNGCGSWYDNNGVTKEDFSKFSFRNGFNKGDIMVLKGAKAESVSIGDVIVFFSSRKDPIIHRVVDKDGIGDEIYFHTKGDNNEDSIRSDVLDETNVKEEVIIGKAILRIPLLGYIKIWFVEVLRLLGINV